MAENEQQQQQQQQPPSLDYWNREISTPRNFDESLPMLRTANILSIAHVDDPACQPLHFPQDSNEEPLSKVNARLVKAGTHFSDSEIKSFLVDGAVNTIYVTQHPNARDQLERILMIDEELAKEEEEEGEKGTPRSQRQIQWIHIRSAGIDLCWSPTLVQWQEQGARAGGDCRIMTNSKGCFSSTLAEYCMMACSYFAKDLPRLLRNQASKDWNKYSVQELRGATLGVVGLGDIGQACARLAKAYGMRVVGVKNKRSSLSNNRNNNQLLAADVVYYSEDEEGGQSAALNKVFAESDYIVSCLPLTAATRGCIGAEQFESVKQHNHVVFINVGRGPVVDETALIQALRSDKLKGAGLDVFAEEPLPEQSPLWDIGAEKVLLSPHNMDQTETFMREATELFVRENLPRFARGLPLLNPVNIKAGY